MANLLLNRRFFPSFQELPLIQEYEQEYYEDKPNGTVSPNRTWTFAAEVVDDQLSTLPNLGYRVEVKDVAGDLRSIIFHPKGGSMDLRKLKRGVTLFIRYAQRVFFSDLFTEAIQVENLDYVKLVPANMDTIIAVASMYERQGTCMTCQSDIAAQGGSALRCESCATAVYCSGECREADAGRHTTFCPLCCDLREVLNLDFDRFIEWVPFR